MVHDSKQLRGVLSPGMAGFFVAEVKRGRLEQRQKTVHRSHFRQFDGILEWARIP